MSSAKAKCARVTLIACLAILTVGIGGCSTNVSEPPQGDDVQNPSVEPSESVQITPATVDEQVATITGRDDVTLTPIDDADAWLGGAGLAAYVDPQTHDEFIVDETRELLLSYEPGTRVYQDPIDLPMYPGEPTRDKVRALADEWAIEYMPDRDISTMRCTAWRRVMGSGPDGDIVEYNVEYRRYVNGVRMPEMASVNITLPTWVWAPSRSAFENVDDYETPPAPQVTMLEALDIATEAAGFEQYAVTNANINYWRGGCRWSFELENRSADQPEFGQHAAWVEVDAITGECNGASFCG